MRAGFLTIIILILIILAILYSTGLIENVQRYLYRKYFLAYECEKYAPHVYTSMIYNECLLWKYNVSKEDLSATTLYKDGICYIYVYYKDKQIAELWYTVDKGSPVICEEIKEKLEK